MKIEPRMTKQGLRDLNHYGPKPSKAAAEVARQASDDAGEVVTPVADKGPDAPLPVEE